MRLGIQTCVARQVSGCTIVCTVVPIHETPIIPPSLFTVPPSAFCTSRVHAIVLLHTPAPGTANRTPVHACCMMTVQSRERQDPLLAFRMLIFLLVAAVLVGLVESFVPPASIRHQRRPSFNNVNIKHHHAPSATSPGMEAAQPLSRSRRLSISRPGPATSMTATRTALRSNRPSSPYDACIVCAPLLSRVSSNDHDHDDNNNSSGGEGGGGGGRGRGGGRGDSNDDDGGSAGDEGFGDGQPLVLAAASGSLAAFLDGLKDAMRQFKMPWVRKVQQRQSLQYTYGRHVDGHIT